MRKDVPRIIILLFSILILMIAGLGSLYLQGRLEYIPVLKNFSTSSPTPTGTTTSTPTALPPTPSATNPPPTASPSPIPPSATPPLPQPQIIGHSIEGRPLEVFQFGNGPVEKMIVAGIHGGYEWNTIVLADELIQYLKSHQEIISPDQTLYILRAFNPDGYNRSRGFGGRANDNNVDLNRNFPSNWKSEWPRPGCWDYIPITGGTSAASEPETQALMAFIEDHDLTAFISYHSAALGIFPGGQPPDKGSISLAETIAQVSAYPYPPIDAGCMFTGQLVDWVSDQGIPAIDIELTNHQDSDFEINLGILSVFLDWSFPE
jgi:predicted deacylase